jgi:integrase
VRLFVDTGMCLDEPAKLRVDDVDLDYDNTAAVLGKGRRPRICPLGAKSAQALDRYLRQRARHKRVDVANALAWRQRPRRHDRHWHRPGDPRARRRSRHPGAAPTHVPPPFAHEWRMAGGDDDSLMRLVGWRSRQMLHGRGCEPAELQVLSPTCRRRATSWGPGLRPSRMARHGGHSHQSGWAGAYSVGSPSNSSRQRPHC